MKLKIHVYSHNFTVETETRTVKYMCWDFFRGLTVEKFQTAGAKDKAKGKTFAFANKERTLFGMHLNVFDKFMLLLQYNGIRESDYEMVYHQLHTPAKAKMKYCAPYEMRPLQLEVIDFINEPIKSRVVPLQTGKGKSAIAIYMMCQMGVRTLLTMNARYITRWLRDLNGETAITDLTVDDVVVIQGTADLLAKVKMARSKDLHAKVIMISNTTMNILYKHYFQNDAEWKKFKMKTPVELFAIFKIGLRIRDEAHEDLHFNFKMDLFTNCAKTIELSATLEFDDKKLNEMCQVLYPDANRFNKGEWDKYTDVTALLYGNTHGTKIRWQMGKFGPYSHTEFEKSIIKNQIALARYLNMLACITVDKFINTRRPNERFIIYAATKIMCGLIVDELSDRFPQLMVKRYIGEDLYEELLGGDIVVTTLKSAGTGVDVPNLMKVLMTTNVSSTQSNVQALGRLRNLERVDEDGQELSPEFYYLVCRDIPQQVKYHNEKIRKFRGKVKNHNVVETSYQI